MNKFKLYKIIFIIFILTSSSLFSKDLKKVTLQLSWFDQFQFAGYYIAKEKGFYRDAGFDVEIKPFNFGLDIPKMVNDNEVDFAIGRETLILEKIKNKKLVALYALFQSTPLVLLSTKQSGIASIEDFKNKKIMTTIDDASEVSLKAMITSHKIKLDDISFLIHSHNINDLIRGNTDVISAYLSKSPYELQKKGIAYNVFDPKKFGFDMYSDFLFTSQTLINKDKKLVEDFKNASLKGWKYAYSNIEETVDLILKKYNSQFLNKDELLFEAEELKKLSYLGDNYLGDIKKEKLQRIYDLYNVMGLITNPIDITQFIINENKKDKKNLSLSNEAIKYIGKQKVINICSIPELKPYSFVENDELKGFVADYFKIISEKSGLNFKHIKTTSLLESLNYLENKKCDILTMAQETQSRKNIANFTNPYLEVPFVLVTNFNTTFIDNLSVLKDKKIGIVKTYSINDSIRKAFPNIDFVEVDSLDDGINKVLNNELYGHIDLLYTSWYKIYSNDLTKLRISAKLDFPIPVSIAVRKDDLVLLDILNEVIASIENTRKDELLKKWITVEYKKEFDYTIVWQIIFVVFVILLAVLYKQKLLKDLNDKLKQKVDEKSEELIKINSSLELRIKEEVDENLRKDRILAQQSKMIAMGQMMENIAHQWRQPLSLITTIASGMKLKNQLNELEPSFIDNNLDSIINTLTYLSNTIDDFRYFFEPKEKMEKFSMEKCCQKAINLIKPSFMIKDIILKLNCESDIVILGYERELIQVLINILNNSRDALNNSSNELKIILINISEMEEKVTIEIKDNAGGIDSEIIEKIYEPYFTTKHQSQGTGIGLFMCEQIITKHMNGKIKTINTEFIYNSSVQKGLLTTIILDKNLNSL